MGFVPPPLIKFPPDADEETRKMYHEMYISSLPKKKLKTKMFYVGQKWENPDGLVAEIVDIRSDKIIYKTEDDIGFQSHHRFMEWVRIGAIIDVTEKPMSEFERLDKTLKDLWDATGIEPVLIKICDALEKVLQKLSWRNSK